MTNQNTTAPAAASIPSVESKDAAATPAAEQPKTAPVDPKAAVEPAAKV